MGFNPRECRFNAIYKSTRSRLLAYALRRTTSPEDAADIVAETFTIAWRRLDDVPEGESSLLWLFVTARQVMANHTRRSQSRRDLVHRMGTELSIGHASENTFAGDAAIEARYALSQLSEHDQELLMLSGWDGLDSSQLGIVLGCSPTAARIRLHHARSRLKGELSDSSVRIKKSTLTEQPNGSSRTISTDVAKEA